MEFKFILAAQMLITFALSYGLVYLVRFYAKRRLIDIPNERSSHSVPTPRGGGLAFVIMQMALVGLFAILDPKFDPNAFVRTIPTSVLFLASSMALLGWLDDHFNISASKRLFCQFAVALITTFVLKTFCRQYYPIFSDFPSLGIFGFFLSVFILVWSTNLFNFMDGIDGLASSEATFFLAVSGYFFMPHSSGLAVICLLFSMTTFAFLMWNWPPAKIFMGDVGSYYLGFIIGLIPLIATLAFDISLIPFLILYTIFWLDTTVTLIRRFIRGEKWTQAHKLHAYQRLHQAGWSHEKIVCSTFALNAMLGTFAITAYHQPDIAYRLLLLSTMLIGLAYALIERINPMYHGICDAKA